ncbi:MAG: hypothetical protein IT381_16285 [Deltaproteobacteria bacterium]|nr:hypothetical protein [Deltaproteobacteria bacterium]
MLKRAFYVTAVANIIACVQNVAMPDMSRTMFFGAAPPFDEATRTTHLLMWLFVGVFGVGYWKAARDEAWVEPLLVLGGCGKVTAAAVWLTSIMNGVRSPFLMLAIAFDGVLGAYFLVTLWRLRGRPHSKAPIE